MDEWQTLVVAPTGTHHLRQGQPAYRNRFDEVLKFHAPGLAAVKDGSGAYHIDVTGHAVYKERYRRTFGFYEERAAVHAWDGWYHLLPAGQLLSTTSYAWCGNFQEGRCAVRFPDQRYGHLRLDGRVAYAARYSYVGDYHDGLAVVQREDGLHTHLDDEGVRVHERWFFDLDVFHKSYARARDKHGWHHIDRSGQPLYPRRFARIEPFYNGQARVESFDGALFVIDEQGADQGTVACSSSASTHAA